jgi:hypothetical protein
LSREPNRRQVLAAGKEFFASLRMTDVEEQLGFS